MSNIAAGGIRLNGLNPKQSIGTPSESQNITLKGINWNTQVSTQNKPVNTNWNNDATKVNQQNYGIVPANDDLPPLFTNNVPETKAVSTTAADPNASTKKADGMVTGIGMAIGAVGGGLIGSRFGFTKIGIGIGTAIGGFTGHFFEK